MTAAGRRTPTYARARRPEPLKVVQVEPDSTTKRVAKSAGKVALFTAANVIGNPVRMVQGMPLMLFLPSTPAEQAASAARHRVRRSARDRQHVIDRHLAGKRQLPVMNEKLRAYQAATGSLPQWFIDATGSTTLH